jgi:hypothetical protein
LEITVYAPVLILTCLLHSVAGSGGNVFPGASWEQRNPADLGLDPAKLDELAERLGGRGCIVKNGYVVKTWGDQTKRGDWASSAKPVLSTMLFFAVEERLVKSVDQRIADFGWALKEKDRTMTFRHLGGMISGYARPEPPGAAWAYNDYAIQLYQKTLFDKVFKQDPKEVCEDPNRLGALHLQDGLKFSEKRRISASVRDWARIAWFWLNRGRWGDRQVLPRRYFDEYMRPQVPKDLLISCEAPTDDYLGIGTYGGESSHFSQCGPGAYGFNWWFNTTGQRHRESLTWPDAPPDTVYTSGARGNCSVMMPSLNLVGACAEGKWGELEPGDPAARLNVVLKLAAGAAGYRPEARALVSGEMKKWQTVTVSFMGPAASEDGRMNPFTDCRLDVTFECGGRKAAVPGYFAADGNPAETGASSGRVWRVRFLPDREGTWTYRARFREGPGVAVAAAADAGKPAAFDGMSGSFTIRPADKSAPGFLGKGLLQYKGERYLRFAETGEYFIKGGADSPENFLAFADFDQTPPTHKYEPHAADWRPGDPTWHKTKGKNIIGALNYLASKKMNSVYFLTMNVNGDGKDVWPWTSQDEQRRFDCSKLDQWEIVFSHMDRLGLMLHVVHQEQENDHLIDGGELGPARKLYYRELIARFAHHPALVWNLGEENRNTDEQRRAFAKYIRDLDPYGHPIVVHTFPSQIEKVYTPLLGYPYLDGPSLQIGKMTGTHKETLAWIRRSAEAGRPWFVCLDEIGPADVCVKPDAQEPGHEDVVRYALWGNLIAGGAGCEWIFAYNTWPRKEHAPHQDTHCEDWRPWDLMWDRTFVALDFFQRYLPFPEMKGDDTLVEPKGSVWCLGKPGQVYAIYVWGGTEAKLDLPAGTFTVEWYDPRKGEPLTAGPTLTGPGKQSLGKPPVDPDKDWVALVRRKP